MNHRSLLFFCFSAFQLFSFSASAATSTIEALTDATTISEGDKVWLADVDGSPADVDATLEQIVSPFAADPSSNSSFDAVEWAADLNITSAWGAVTGTPTTLSGYGITDAYTVTAADAAFDAIGSAATVQADVDQNESDADTAIALKLDATATAADSQLLDGLDSTAFATAAELLDKADVTAMDAALAVRTVPLRSGIYATGSDEAVSIPQQIATDIITNDFSRVLPVVVLADWSPTTRVILWTNDDGANTGIRLALETDGTLTLEFGDGSDWDASYSTTVGLSSQPAYAALQLTIAADRSGFAQLYRNGIALEAIDISGASAINVDTASAWRILDGAEGWVYGQYGASTELITSAQALQYYTLPDSQQRTTAGLKYTSDFSTADLQGFNDISSGGSVPLSNQTADGEAGWIQDTPQDNGITKGIKSAELVTVIAGRTYRVLLDVFTPAGSAIDDFTFRWQPGNTTYIGLTAGNRQSVDKTFTATDTTNLFIIQPRSGGVSSFAGDLVDDIFYFKNITLIEQGIVEVIDCSASGATKPDLVASNDAARGATSTDAL